MLKSSGVYVDLPEVGPDPFHVHLDRMIELIHRQLA